MSCYTVLLDQDPREHLTGSTTISTVSYFTISMLSGGLSSQEPGAIRGVSGTWSTGVTAISGKAFAKVAFLLSRRSLAVPLSAFFLNLSLGRDEVTGISILPLSFDEWLG